MRSERQPPTSGAVAFPLADRADVGVVGVVRNLAGAVAAEHVEEPLLREGRGLRVAHAEEPVAVEGGEARALPDGHVERGDVREADERLRVGGNDVEVEEAGAARPSRSRPAGTGRRPPPGRRRARPDRSRDRARRPRGSRLWRGRARRASRGSPGTPTTRRFAGCRSGSRTGSPARRRRSSRPRGAAARTASRRSRAEPVDLGLRVAGVAAAVRDLAGRHVGNAPEDGLHVLGRVAVAADGVLAVLVVGEDLAEALDREAVAVRQRLARGRAARRSSRSRRVARSCACPRGRSGSCGRRSRRRSARRSRSWSRTPRRSPPDRRCAPAPSCMRRRGRGAGWRPPLRRASAGRARRAPAAAAGCRRARRSARPRCPSRRALRRSSRR